MRKFNLANTITGWIVFAISTIVYLLTLEPTASFWDCGEFISAAYKFEVGHPPGAPFFLLLGRFFTLFAGGNVSVVARMVNIMSALASSFTILFLFWSITHLARKLFIKNEDYSLSTLIIILGSGTVGALAYTFTDSFWFSAVEGEVYATSSLFTALVFWAILKWEENADAPHANRWIILIAYLMGLSIGVHLLNLLAIPAIVLVYYFKKYQPTIKGTCIAILVSFVILAVIMYGIIQGILKIAIPFELFFVNTLGMGYNSGLLVYLILLTGISIWAVYYTSVKKMVLYNTIINVFLVIMLGYSSYALIVIRSMANPPMDQNNPENLFNLLAYLNRDQYGDRPLIYGNYYNAPIIETKNGSPIYSYINGRYEITNYKPEYKYDDRFMTFFPRMHSNAPDHIEEYKRWGKIKGRKIQIQNPQTGEPVTDYIPTFSENLRFFFTYQIGFMYMRYFMWNFAGRQNDIQGHGNKIHGNWISGITPFDEARLGPQRKMPDELKNNRGRNNYYFLPLLLGLAGMLFQYKRSKKDFLVVGLLFFMTGLAIVIYLNQTPLQPRERDYAYAASFYAFAIWIGFGVALLADIFRRFTPATISAVLATFFTLILVPGVMAHENWDDHNRAHRFTARDFAINYLESCEKNAFLFTNGDNDTFPLWYVQEVEGVRTDVRVVNLSYIGADWYIDQMKRKAYDSDPIPISLTRDKYIQGKRDVVYLIEQGGFNQAVDIHEALRFIASDDVRTKYKAGDGSLIDYLPTKRFIMKIDTVLVRENGTVPPEYFNMIKPVLQLSLRRNYIIKNDLMVLDLLATNNFKRPMYFAITVSNENYLGLENYFQLHGLAYRVIPVYNKSDDLDVGGIDVNSMYNNLMNKFRWGNVNDPRVYLNEDNRRMLSNYRSNFSRLAARLVDMGRKDSALKVLNRCMEIMPDNVIPYNYFNLSIADSYFRLGKKDEALGMLKRLAGLVKQNLDYYIDLKNNADDLEYDKKLNLHILQQIILQSQKNGFFELQSELESAFNNYIQIIGPTLKQ